VSPRLDRERRATEPREPGQPLLRADLHGGQVARWARAGRLHPASREVIAALDPAVGQLLYWSCRDLDASVELDDVVQTLALAQLEAQAAAEPSLRLGAQRRLRRWVWRVRWGRGRQRRLAWDDARMQSLAGPDSGLAAAEEIVWDDVVRLLGWRDGVLVWLWAVEEWSLSELSAWRAVSKQHIWRRVRRGLARLRAALAADHGPRR